MRIRFLVQLEKILRIASRSLRGLLSGFGRGELGVRFRIAGIHVSVHRCCVWRRDLYTVKILTRLAR
jgi:hypothetical protein